MRIENRQEVFQEVIQEVFLNIQGLLPTSVQQGYFFVKDATGREFKLLVYECQSREVSDVHRIRITLGTRVDSFPRISWVHWNGPYGTPAGMKSCVVS